MIRIAYVINQQGTIVNNGDVTFLVRDGQKSGAVLDYLEKLTLHTNKYVVPFEEYFDQKGRPPAFKDSVLVEKSPGAPWDMVGKFVDTPLIRENVLGSVHQPLRWYEGNCNHCHRYFELLQEAHSSTNDRVLLTLLDGPNSGAVLFVPMADSRFLDVVIFEGEFTSVYVYQHVGGLSARSDGPVTGEAEYVREYDIQELRDYNYHHKIR